MPIPGKLKKVMQTTIFKIMTEDQWEQLEAHGTFAGAAIDLTDGYIHFSYAEQVSETAIKHFGGQSGLRVVAVDTAMLGTALKAEPSRGGALFPHLYAPLSRDAVRWASPLLWREDGMPDWQPPAGAKD
jgi:uncharacterized protein (DUF952 family)